MPRKHKPFPLILLSSLVVVLVAIVTAIVTAIAPDLIAVEDARITLWGLAAAVIILVILVATEGYWRQRYKADGAGPESIAEPQALRNRQAMLKKVRKDWIGGVLEQSLYQVARIDLGLKTAPAAVASPWNLTVHRPDQKPCWLPSGTRISTVFESEGKALAILGEPGCGKTTVLLELTRDLLDQAENDPKRSIPVVFNLSSWAVRRAPLEEWLVDELCQRYYVPRKVAQAWVETDQLALLLDGLDEVAEEHRLACLEAINRFHEGHGAVPLAVCSRIAEYEKLLVQLKLREAVVIQPLTREQVSDYLAQAGDQLAGVGAVVQTDEVLGELLHTPLMLWVASLAYRGRPASEVRFTGTLEERRQELFSRYVEAMFERPGRAKAQAPYTKEQTMGWLTWLASTLKQQGQTTFFLEEMQPDWLPTRTQRRAMQAGTVILTLLLFVGLVVVVVVGGGLGLVELEEGLVELVSWLIFLLVVGLVVGLVFGLRRDQRIKAVETLSFSWRKAFKGLVVGLVVGLIYLLVFELVFGLAGGLFGLLVVGLVFGLAGGLVFLLVFLLCVGLAVGLIFGLETGRIETRIAPNEGMRRSARIAIIVSLVFGLVVWLVFGLVVGLSFLLVVGLVGELFELLVVGLVVWLVVGLGVGLKKGGWAVLQHTSLRIVLWMKGYAPLRYVRFLNHATQLIFLRQVGGGYVFIHRLLLEHFASLPPRTQAPAAQTG